MPFACHDCHEFHAMASSLLHIAIIIKQPLGQPLNHQTIAIKQLSSTDGCQDGPYPDPILGTGIISS
jgi:hypothetical protein